MFTARWNSVEIARSASCISVENTHYFPPDTVDCSCLTPGEGESVCEWKGGTARYFDIHADGQVNRSAAWSYPKTGARAKAIEGWFGFWKGVEVQWEGAGPPAVQTLDHALPNAGRALGAKTVQWRPHLTWLPTEGPFAGYLIPEQAIAVDVIADPGPADKARILSMTRDRARSTVAAANAERAAGRPAPRYLAVWGSADPSPAALSALARGHSVLDLFDTPEVIEATGAVVPRHLSSRAPRSGRVLSVNVGRIASLRQGDKEVLSAIRKQPVRGPLRATGVNLDGDDQADRTVHGGRDKAIYAFPHEHYARWKDAFSKIDFSPGTMGENLTVDGLDERTLIVGDRYRCGTAELMVTQPRLPCFKFVMRLGDSQAARYMTTSGFTGFYLAIVREGTLQAGDELEWIEGPEDGITVHEIVRLYVEKTKDPALIQKALDTPALPEDWKTWLKERR